MIQIVKRAQINIKETAKFAKRGIVYQMEDVS